jgi:DNA repair exonuclease SbcCD ATPase subunit
MDEHTTQILERLTAAAEALENAVARLDAQHEALNAKVERIVAAIDESLAVRADSGADGKQLQARVAELEQANHELKAQAARLTRKTLPPLVSTLLAKSAGEAAPTLDPAALDKALGSLSLEQRIAVKAEMARAGMIE